MASTWPPRPAIQFSSLVTVARRICGPGGATVPAPGAARRARPGRRRPHGPRTQGRAPRLRRQSDGEDSVSPGRHAGPNRWHGNL
eukprot:52328-Hanusia_phi.AAC.1